jgi:uncharacterized protein (TIGR03000 family)
MYSMVLMAALASGADAPACHWRSCHGGYGGCYGCHGCYGSVGHGGHGCHGGWGCHGCHGGWGSHGCYGSYGGCYGCHGCYGATGYYGCYGCAGGYAPAYGVVPTGPPVEAVPAEKLPVNPKKKTTSAEAERAQLVVELPTDAKLYVDGSAVKSTAAKRTFSTPPLEPGQAYYYMLRAEVVRDGQTIAETARVIVRAGEVARASFPNLETPDTATAQTISR